MFPTFFLDLQCELSERNNKYICFFPLEIERGLVDLMRLLRCPGLCSNKYTKYIFKCNVHNKENVTLFSELISYTTRFSQCNSPWAQALQYIQSWCTQGCCQQWASGDTVIVAILLLKDVMVILQVLANAFLIL